ncbi:MAG: ATPase, T2SS/T4P/T4SS family [Thaumarchaeota archaeon]|nr:ATPase, T2SS/T4P/T4SS family [Nitrososphaerota archaeon]
MEDGLGGLVLKLARRKKGPRRGGPLLVELMQPAEGDEVEAYGEAPFEYAIKKEGSRMNYQILPAISSIEVRSLRSAVSQVSESLDPASIEPLTFAGLVERLSQSAVSHLAGVGGADRVKALSRLTAFEAVGIPTVYALSLDRSVSEFFVDAPASLVYLDHSRYGRCETPICLTEREREAIKTHMDTFKGYTLDFSNPSLKNEFDIFGNRLRVSLDLPPLAVNGFSLDVRKLTSAALTLDDLVKMDVLSAEAAAFLVAALELGMNVSVVGETGTGKTTLLNALDEALDPQLRRIYIEDAVETKDLLWRGYHQMKLRVDPLERGGDGSRTKSEEIIKILHRSPDLVILGEIQSDEHSKAFFHALSAGIRGLQTFHASSPEQAIRRWTEMHGISRSNLLDLDVVVQMSRPEKLGSTRLVENISVVAEEDGEPKLRGFYAREDGRLQRTSPWERLQIRRPSLTNEMLVEKIGVVSGLMEARTVTSAGR